MEEHYIPLSQSQVEAHATYITAILFLVSFNLINLLEKLFLI
jgi:hypothetical protein